jgi:hypothetical protein
VGVAFLTVCPSRALCADDKKPWEEAEFKKLSGRWTTFREEKTGQDKIRRSRVDLEFAGGKLKVFILDQTGARTRKSQDEIKVLGAEEIKGLGLGSIARLILGNERQKAEVYYDFVGDRLILVGRIGFRPWEGFHLSGEYKRAEKPQ